MNRYLDASALVKEYLTDEMGAGEIAAVRRGAQVVGTTIVSRAEVSAALAKAVRVETLTRTEARSALEAFRGDWADLFSLNVNGSIATRAERLAWGENLRGYDAVQLASALMWKESIAGDVTFATFDVALWDAAGRRALTPFPEDLPDLLAAWNRT